MNEGRVILVSVCVEGSANGVEVSGFESGEREGLLGEVSGEDNWEDSDSGWEVIDLVDKVGEGRDFLVSSSTASFSGITT